MTGDAPLSCGEPALKAAHTPSSLCHPRFRQEDHGGQKMTVRHRAT